MNKKRMLVLSYGNFPNGDASSIRLDCLTTLMKNAGFEIYIVSMARIEPNTWIDYNGKKYISIRSTSGSIIKRLGNVLGYKQRVKKIIDDLGKVDALFLASAPLECFIYFERYAKSNDIQLYADRTEWYSPNEFKFGKLHPTYWANITINKKLIDRQWKVISISKYFESYYTSKGINTTRIPAIMDTQGIAKWEANDSQKITVVYAGSPAKKDSLNLIVEGYKCLDDKYKDKIHLKVIGVSEGQYRELYGETEEILGVQFLGRVSRETVLSNLEHADFSTLMRDNTARFAKAGFPSKVAESLSVGIPMITNFTSDLELYLKDGSNSIIVEDYSAEAYCRALIRASELSGEVIEKMHINARKTAEEVFDYRNYSDAVCRLISD